jgi:L-threonylcarbamoyladenylate synthase
MFHLLKQRYLSEAIKVLTDGGIIAYPTEAVYGLGCDPFNETAVRRLLAIKQRSVEQGLILIASEWQQVHQLVKPIAAENMAQVEATWPGPVTWLFPASAVVPTWIRGQHSTIAIRITSHSIAKQLCQRFNKPIVSTSANVSGQEALRDTLGVKLAFNNKIDYILPGRVNGLANPSEIRDAISGEIIRPGS